MNPSITACRHRFEKPRFACLVAEHAPDLGDDTSEGVVSDGGTWPDEVEDLLLREEVTRPLDHHGEQVERFRLERDWSAFTFESVRVEVENVAVPAVS
jgi:hypothetical protein